MKELQAIQQQLSCPKDRRNEFGKFNYRSCSDILDAFKKVANGCSIVVTDNIVEIGGSIFVEATATIIAPNGERESSKGYAQISEHKGMDAAQCTGACSSYARKYALNGLLAIDDTADNDALTPEEPQTTKAKKKKEVTPAEAPQPVQAAPIPTPAPKPKRTIRDDQVQQVINWANEHGKNLAFLMGVYEFTPHQLNIIQSQIS